ncbi:LOW QUALITY PROTEIN: pygopus homolog 2 [Callospermophilus lateralis]
MKSPEKKPRKSNTRGPYSRLTKFASPPTPMVDCLVASNPFEGDFEAPKVGGAAPPFLSSSVPFGSFRIQGSMAGQVPPGCGTGGGGGPQTLPDTPPFPPNPMGPAFNMPPQGPGYPPPGKMNFPSQPFSQPLGPNFSAPGGQMMPGPLGGFGPMISPTMGQPPRGELGPPSLPQSFAQPGVPFGPSPLQRPSQGLPSLPPNTSPFPGPDPGFPGPGGEEGKPLNPPAPTAFPQEPHSGSAAAAVNGNQPSFPPNSSGRGGSTPDANSLAPPGKAGGSSGPQPPPGLLYPRGACGSEANDGQGCEASCQKWFHRSASMTESRTTGAPAVWACDLCLKTKEIQSVYIRAGMGQLVAANDG